jgi:competence protein ComEA
MSSENADPRNAQPHWLLRRADQAVVAVLVSVGLATTIGWWIAQGGLQGRLIEIDRAGPQTAQFQVDINEADWPELAELPGIGQTLSHRIVACRRADGPFIDHDDLRRRVRGIGPKTLEAIRPYLRPMPPGSNVAAK